MITILKGVWMCFAMMLIVTVLGHGEPTMFDLLCEKVYQAIAAWEPGK
jgi:hypothetical protein